MRLFQTKFTLGPPGSTTIHILHTGSDDPFGRRISASKTWISPTILDTNDGNEMEKKTPRTLRKDHDSTSCHNPKFCFPGPYFDLFFLFGFWRSHSFSYILRHHGPHHLGDLEDTHLLFSTAIVHSRLEFRSGFGSGFYTTRTWICTHVVYYYVQFLFTFCVLAFRPSWARTRCSIYHSHHLPMALAAVLFCFGATP